jgi:hypothetical protein
MTTAAQVKRLVQPLLQRNPDLALVGRLVFIKPVHHILRGILIGRTFAAKYFVPNWSAIFLFQPNAHFHFFLGTRMLGDWDFGVPGVSETLADAIEQEALPVLRSIVTIDDFVRFARGRWVEDEKPYVDVARGDLEAAQSMCEFFASLNGRFGIRHEEIGHVVHNLCPLIAANDRRTLAQLLHKYEAESVKGLKLEKFWEPTPFPIEMAQ